MKTTFYRDETFSLEYTLFENIWFIHCEVSDWKPSSLKRGLRVFRKMHEEAARQGIYYLMSITPNPRFCELLAGKFIKKVKSVDGKEYEVYKWELIQ